MGQIEEVAAFLLFFLIRGLLVWLVIPIGFLLWVVLLLIGPVLRKWYLRPWKVIGWLDLNVSVLIGQVLLRPVGRSARFVGWSQIDTTEHRISLIDPW